MRRGAGDRSGRHSVAAAPVHSACRAGPLRKGAALPCAAGTWLARRTGYRGGRVAGGTGNPFFSTDTAGVLRALEIEAEVILKATNVDGIYTSDPRKNPNAEFIPELSFQEAIVKNYAVMDANAFGLCKANNLPIIVFNMNRPGAISRVLQGDRVGTIVR